MSSNLLLEYSILGWTETLFYSLHLSNKKNISRFKDTKLIKDWYFQVTLVQPLSLQCSINSSNLCWLFPINGLICSFLQFTLQLRVHFFCPRETIDGPSFLGSLDSGWPWLSKELPLGNYKHSRALLCLKGCGLSWVL